MNVTDKILSAWIDGGLSAEKMNAVSIAVQSDPELQQRANALRAVGAAMREESCEIPVTAERMVMDVRREIRRNESPRAYWSPLWVRAGAAVCSCLVLAALWMSSIRGSGAPVGQTEIENVNSALSGVSPMVYTDYESGWTIIWLDNVELGSGI